MARDVQGVYGALSPTSGTITTVNPHLTWRRSTRCANSTCVEVAATPHTALMRDSKRPDSPILVFGHAEWRAFITDIRNGEHDY